jgi:hypothetical protein
VVLAKISSKVHFIFAKTMAIEHFMNAVRDVQKFLSGVRTRFLATRLGGAFFSMTRDHRANARAAKSKQRLPVAQDGTGGQATSGTS